MDNDDFSSTRPEKAKKAQVFAKDEDKDVIIRPPGGKTLGQKCGNPQCYIRASEATLKTCARCKTVRYCSRQCQVTNWKSHKDWCNKNVEHAAALVEADALGYTKMLGVPEGLTLKELDEKLEKWVKVQNSLLMAATIHALALPRDLRRSHLYMLRVTVRYRHDHDGVPAKFFRVSDAKVIDFVSARALGGVWPVSIDHIVEMREESERAKRGTVAAIGLECDPLAMQVVPFGSLRDLSPLKLQPKWKDILISDVETGKKFTRFEMN
ncbi:hypothetical protein BYT27DRAFT_7182621 [Phlegmacium glaucopus]|nr:hypothetical protein BYT27DRAFT_7182621 [Phlegmacium glaucopus]